MKSQHLLSMLSGVAFASVAAAHPGHDEPHDSEPQLPKVVAVEYSDFQCTPCAEVAGLLEKLVGTKKVALQVLFKHSPAHPDALVAHEASLAAAAQGKFWEMHDLLFTNPKANYAEIIEMATSLELDVKRFQDAIDERTYRGRVMSEIAEAQGLGVRLTPTVFLNGRRLEGIDEIRSFVEAVINPPADAVDPDQIHEFDLAGSPSTGPEAAPVTIVEFSDFRCGFCGAHSHTVSKLIEAYPGKVRRVFKHFPIEVSEEGKLPHLGAMAAREQGKFWEMYRALMNRPLTGRDDLISRAVAIGLDMERFERALTNGEGGAILERDMAEGERHGIRMTPTTFINGRMLGGRQSLEALQERVEAILNPGAEQPPPPVAGSGPAENPAVRIEYFADFADSDRTNGLAALAEYRHERQDAELQLFHYPSQRDPAAWQAHRAVIAAGEQGKLWEMIELMAAAPANPGVARLSAMAGHLGLDMERYTADFEDSRHDRTILADLEEGRRRGLTGKPAVFFNGKRLEGESTVADLRAAGEACCARRRGASPPQPGAPDAEVDVFGPTGGR